MARTPRLRRAGHDGPPEPGAFPGGAVAGHRLGGPDAQQVLLPSPPMPIAR